MAKDLTATNRQVMINLYNNAAIEKQWLDGTTIKFVLKADLATVHTVVNPFAADRASMLIPII